MLSLEIIPNMNADPYQNAGRAPGGVQFRKGQMLHFITTRPFTLGQAGVPVRAGTDILFDGTDAEVDGSEYKLPFLRGAYKAGWMVLAEDYDEGDPNYARRTRADIQVRPVNGGNPLQPQAKTHIVTTESDEREVGNTRSHAQRTASNNRDFVRGRTAVNTLEPGSMVRTQRGMMEVEAQDGIELDRKLTTPAGERSKERIDLSSDRAAKAMQVAKNAQITAGEGISEEDMLGRMSEEDREEYLLKKEALRSQYVGESQAPTAALPRPNSRKVVARVQSKSSGHSEGMNFKNSVGGGSRIGDESDGEIVGTVHSAKDDIQSFEQDGIKFTTTNGPRRGAPKAGARHVAEDDDEIRVTVKPVKSAPSAEAPPPVPANLDVRRQIAKSVCPDFPENYDFTLSPKKKLARLEADFSERSDVLRAVYAAESDDMKALLLQEFPQAFAS